MSADTITISGSISIVPTIGVPSGFPNTEIPIDESIDVGNQQPSRYILTNDAPGPIDVDFGGCDGVNFVQVESVGGPVDLIITWAGGTSQKVPVDPMLILITRGRVITAIQVQRASINTNETTVQIYLGEEA